MTSKIGLEDVRFHAPHGFFDEEQVMGNEFSIDVTVEAMVMDAAEHDDLGGTVNYATIYYLLQAEMKKPTRLLEALAHRMAGRIKNQFDGVQSVTLKIRKLHPPLGGRVGAAFVEVTLSDNAPGMAAVPGQHTFEDDPDDYDDSGFGDGGNFDFSKFNL
ncbi:dihydroneopterin aldolase [Lewinella sp. IMCC34191]|uniref:dihydroneopterin aldolase n=1 Tax=Lewinella sp. IMCC34191 TaxID=2259172 RepID=UPI000E26DB69|nr:dihydroneopterin aldolase [Lewinella sp. IMCC34191]